jgi:hypothetical protein
MNKTHSFTIRLTSVNVEPVPILAYTFKKFFATVVVQLDFQGLIDI